MSAYALTPVERLILAQQHRILAKLATDGDPHGDQEAHEHQAEVLERGFVSEYDTVLAAIEPEMAEADSKYVMDVLTLFQVIEHGFGKLSQPEREKLGAGAESRLQFSGFDGHESRELQMLGFARYLISQGRWSDLASHFGSQGGDSHVPMLDVYTRMLAEYRAIRDARGTSPLRDPLTVDELRRILEARAGA